LTHGSTMWAAVVERKDGPFQTVEVPRPEPAAGELLVRIRASGVNPLDAKIRAGMAEHARQPLPAILGLDLAGTVAAVGEGVTNFRVGDDVYGMTGGVGGHQGSLAEYAAVDARLVARKPRNLTMREAASLPLVFITAWEGLVDRAQVRAGHQVLVQGGSEASVMSPFKSPDPLVRKSMRPRVPPRPATFAPSVRHRSITRAKASSSM
jgi:NADPH:quinone reductase